MTYSSLVFPMDDITGVRNNIDLALDWPKLTAFLARDSLAFSTDIANQITIASGSIAKGKNAFLPYEGTDIEIENIVVRTVERAEDRSRSLGLSYPFDLDSRGNILRYNTDSDLGQTAYLLCLVLSKLDTLSPILCGSSLHPDKSEVKRIRQYFQYFATAALAAEIQGQAWSFGFPCLDRSGFVTKLEEIWATLRDGNVGIQQGAPPHAKDDQIDVFAARLHLDRLPGFPLLAAQVATGQDAWQKSLKGHVDVFRSRWFHSPPVTDFIPYIIVPFASEDREFIDHVRVGGNVLHRLRLPRRVSEAQELVRSGVSIEGYAQLAGAMEWVADYRSRATDRP